MMKKLQAMVFEASRSAAAVRGFRGTIRIISHYDADGLSSASILSTALAREGKAFRLSVIKQLSEDKIRELSKEKNPLMIFSDLGSGHAESIQEHLSGSTVIILDHHQVKGKAQKSGNLFHINPALFGISDNLSGAGVAYFFAKELNPENADLSHLAVVGALGDSQAGSIEGSWGLAGANKEIIKDAKKAGRLSVDQGLRLWGRRTRSIHKALEYCTDPFIPGVSGSESGSVQMLNELSIPLRGEKGWRTLSDLTQEEQKRLATAIIRERIGANHENPHEIFGEVYELPGHPEEFMDAHEFATILNACGKLGKPDVGISMCMLAPQAFLDARSILASYRKDVGKALRWLNGNSRAIRPGRGCTCIFGGSMISEHIISNVTSMLSKSGFVPEDRPVIAFADADDGMVKVSARAHDSLVEGGLSMEALLSAAASRLGGEGGGHKGAAGATIPKGAEEEFILQIEEMLETQGLLEPGKAVNNININMPQQEDTPEGRRPEASEKVPSINDEVDYGTADSQRGENGSEASGDAFRHTAAFKPAAGEEACPGDKAPAATAAERSGLKKMEGQGLVRYLGAKDVQ